MAKASIQIRPIDPLSQAEVELVAARMRETLVEVLGKERGEAMYTLEWLQERVRFHLDPKQSTAAVLLAVSSDARILGHTIVREEKSEDGSKHGLFSTTYVEQASRRLGVADQLLASGEDWIRGQGLKRAATATSQTNLPLIRLYEKHGYTITGRFPDIHMILLTRDLS